MRPQQPVRYNCLPHHPGRDSVVAHLPRHPPTVRAWPPFQQHLRRLWPPLSTLAPAPVATMDASAPHPVSCWTRSTRHASPTSQRRGREPIASFMLAAMPPVGSRRPERATYSSRPDLDRTRPRNGREVACNRPHKLAGDSPTILWNSSPDAILAEEVQHNRLNTPAAIERQVRRMLADDRAQAFVSTFFVPWLQLDELAQSLSGHPVLPGLRAVAARRHGHGDRTLPPQSTARRPRPRRALERQLHLSQRTTRPPLRHRRRHRSTVPSGPAPGAGAGRTPRPGQRPDGHVTSSARRGRRLYVPRQAIDMGPPAFLRRAAARRLPRRTTGEAGAANYSQTRTLPAEPCGNCHRNFFPIGYALENFDPLGRWRTHDQPGPVDSSGTFVDGTPTNGIIQLPASGTVAAAIGFPVRRLPKSC